MPSGRSRQLPPLSADTGPAHASGPRQTLTLPAVPAAPVPPSPALAPRPQTRSAPPRSARASVRRRAWPRLVLRVLILPALLFAVLVPPQSLRATLVTLLIVAALGMVVWRLPMADDE